MADGRPASPILPVTALTLNALIWGLSWWPFRALDARGVHALWATALVFSLAFGVVWLGVRAWRPQVLRGALASSGLWLLALAAGFTNVGFNWAVTTGDVVRVVLLFYLMPAWVVLLAWPLLGERPGLGALSRLVLALVGVLLVLKTPDSPWPVPESLPDWLALAAGFCFALTNILLRRLQGCSDAARMLAMFAGGGVVALLVAGVGGWGGWVPLPPAPESDWLLLAAGLGVAFLAGNMALQYGAARLRANTSSLVMLSEVVFASLSAVWLGAAQLESRTLLGGALIVLAALMASWAQMTPSTPKPETAA